MRTPDWFAKILDCNLTELQVEQLYRHYELLLRWNDRMNLTTVKAGREMVTRHYSESLFFATHLPAPGDGISVLDLGSGGGFPGLPMAVLRPFWKVALIESHQRKSVFLRESTRHLSNVSVVGDRIENLSLHADWAVARAVDPHKILENIPRLANNVGLMIGEDDFSSVRNDPRIAWRDPIRLPWGDRRICAYGTFHVEQSS